MNPYLAYYLCTAGIVYLIVRDVKQTSGVSRALWIPQLWLLIIASRLPTEWMTGGAVVMSSGSEYLEGSPLDRNIFLLLMVLGVVALTRRTIAWGSVATRNAAIAFFFAYTLLSIIWSDFPVVAFKRWHKVFGHVIMVMVVLTEPNPTAAFAALLRRTAYVLLPYSVVYIKYFPELGRDFDGWTGAAVNTGITTNKNALANLCQITGLYFVAVLFAKVDGRRIVAGLDRWIVFAFLYMVGWLLFMAQSSTATVSTLLGAAAIIACRISVIRRFFSALMITMCLAVGWAFAYTDLKDSMLESLGEDATLTGRTDLWAELAQADINPVIGVGFESFWLGERLEPLWEKYWWKPNQAHNGYFETYLNLGYIGLFAMLAMVIGGYRHARRQSLGSGPPSDADAALSRSLGEFRLGFILSLIAYNFTEATFKALHPSFFTFFLASVNYTPALVAAAIPAAVGFAATRDPKLPALNRPRLHGPAVPTRAPLTVIHREPERTTAPARPGPRLVVPPKRDAWIRPN